MPRPAINVAVKAARAAGSLIVRNLNRVEGLAVVEKERMDFASDVDRMAEQLILREGPETVAAFIAEPLQAAGGVLVPPPGYFPAIQEVLRRHDVLLIADEVVCGFGRLGCWLRWVPGRRSSNA